MSERAAAVQRAGLDLCALVAVKGVDVLALAGAARRRLARPRPTMTNRRAGIAAFATSPTG